MNKIICVVVTCLITAFSLPAISGIKLDTSFGDGGYVQTNIATYDNSNQTARSLLVQADGKIVVAGIDNNGNDTDFALIRYNTDGSRDPGFGEGGEVSTDILGASADQLYDLVQQADGKIVAVGDSSSGLTNDIVLIRYNIDGSVDDTFGAAGRVISDTGGADIAFSVIVQDDQKLLIGAVTDNFMTLVRYSEDGVLDTDFGDQGFAVLNDDLAPYSFAGARDVVQQADGKLVAIGSKFIVRFNTNGTLDTSFDVDGFNAIPASFSYTTSIAQQAGGGFLVTGPATGGDFAIARFLSTGALDTDFGTLGVVTTDVGSAGDRPGAILVDDTDDRFLITGSGADGADNQLVLLRYDANGTLDTSFSDDGKVETIIGDIRNFGMAVAQQTDSKYVVAARAIYSGDQDFATLRYDNDGNLDTGFNTNGVKVDWIGRNTKDVAVSLVAQADDKLIAGGRSSYSTSGDLNSPTDISLVRYNTNGSLDTGFAVDGLITKTIVTPYGGTKDLIGQVDGKIVSLVETYDGSTSGGALVRHNSDGSLDLTFGTNGITTLNDVASGGIQQLDGKLLVFVDGDFRRFDTLGSLDTTFGAGGSVTTGVCSFGARGCGRSAIIEQSGGKLVIAGGDGLERYTSSGALDTSFGAAGQVVFPEPVFWATIVEQSDDKLVVAFLPVDATNTVTLIRYSADGEIDPSFGTAGTVTTIVNDSVGYTGFHALELQEDGKLAALVRVDSFNFLILRYNTDGSLDLSFDDDGLFPLPFSVANVGGTSVSDGDMVYQSGAFYVLVANEDDFFMARFTDDRGSAPVAESPVANNVTQSNAGDTNYTFSIRYTDVDGDFDFSSVNASDVSVCNGNTCGVIFGAGGISSDQSSANASYGVTPPGGSWDEADNGTYTISILANEVADDELNYVAADANAGSFTVSIVDPTIPGAPVIVSGTPANTGALIAFTPPIDDGGAEIIEYIARCYECVDAVGTTSPLLVSGLSNGVAYEFYVFARNSVGTGAASNRVWVTPTDGGEVTLPPSGDGSGEAVTFTHSATNPDGGAPVSATLEVVATDPLPQEPPPAEAESLVAAIDISSTGSVAGYTMAVTFEIDPGSINIFTGFWKYGKEAPGDTPHWYDYGPLDAFEPGTGFELSEDRKTLTVYFTDGLRGDDDLTVNASIVDPALPIIQIDPLIFEDGFD